MKTTHFSNGDLLFFHHHQIAHFPYHLHQYVGGRQFPPPPPPPPYLTTSAAAEYTSHHHVLHICRSSRLDSNAESYRANNKSDFVNIDEDDDDNEDIIMQQLDDNLEEFIDSLWIFKVLRSYGLMLPFIIISMLITTGLKAFLLAFALPLGQSTFSYAIQKMQQEKSSTTIPSRLHKTKASSNKKSSYTRSSSDNRNNVKKTKDRKSRDPNNDDNNNDSSDQDAVTYGGWD